MYTWSFAYNIDAIRAWMFAQKKSEGRQKAARKKIANAKEPWYNAEKVQMLRGSKRGGVIPKFRGHAEPRIFKGSQRFFGMFRNTDLRAAAQISGKTAKVVPNPVLSPGMTRVPKDRVASVLLPFGALKHNKSCFCSFFYDCSCTYPLALRGIRKPPSLDVFRGRCFFLRAGFLRGLSAWRFYARIEA